MNGNSKNSMISVERLALLLVAVALLVLSCILCIRSCSEHSGIETPKASETIVDSIRNGQRDTVEISQKSRKNKTKSKSRSKKKKDKKDSTKSQPSSPRSRDYRDNPL